MTTEAKEHNTKTDGEENANPKRQFLE